MVNYSWWQMMVTTFLKFKNGLMGWWWLILIWIMSIKQKCVYSHGTWTTIKEYQVPLISVTYIQLVHWFGLDRRLSCNQAAQTKLSLGRGRNTCCKLHLLCWGSLRGHSPSVPISIQETNVLPEICPDCISIWIAWLFVAGTHSHRQAAPSFDLVASVQPNKFIRFRWYHFKAAASWSQLQNHNKNTLRRMRMWWLHGTHRMWCSQRLAWSRKVVPAWTDMELYLENASQAPKV